MPARSLGVGVQQLNPRRQQNGPPRHRPSTTALCLHTPPAGTADSTEPCEGDGGNPEPRSQKIKNPRGQSNIAKHRRKHTAQNRIHCALNRALWTHFRTSMKPKNPSLPLTKFIRYSASGPQLRGGIHGATPEHMLTLKRLFLTFHSYCTADNDTDLRHRFELPREKFRPPQRIPSSGTQAFAG